PGDFKYLVDSLHQAGIGVILDWVPSHFPGDAHGLFKFDGTHLYEHADPRKGFHPDWKSYIFNYGRNEVRSFLISNAIYWLDQYHIDGLRVDAVASMLYLDYSRKEGEWIPNEYGGRENIESIVFLKEFNETAYGQFPDIVTIAEESTAWPGVSRPTYLGGLGFGQKWMMGWMHDTLQYFKNDPIHRRYHQNEITFSIMYAFTENFMLPLSHDEVVHGKGSLMGRMPGDEWRRFANLRLLYGYMYTHPGTKLLFMGGEFGQTSEWNHDRSLDWHLLDHSFHQGVHRLTKDLNNLYKTERALYHYSFDERGFKWVDYSDHQNSVIIYQRKSDIKEDDLIVICNFTPEVRSHYRIGVPYRGEWKEIFNSDNLAYSGSGVLNQGMIFTSPVKYHGWDYSVSITLPPLGIIVLKLEREQAEFELGG
ncbi:MAG TPA: 1,4-alpha-glucan branching protein GlgB, partial [Cyclobacteriaceae bacterium]|nr:1,4-alpha-glucan branching protein GlgB [Cyclobacteriaceae bacterium]